MYSASLFSATVEGVITSRLSDSWAWFLIRGSGLMSLALLFLIMIAGIGHITGWTYRFVSPVKAWAIHKALAIMLGISIALHMTGLLFDHYVNFSIAQILVPFLKNYSNGTLFAGFNLGWLGVPAGILAAYGIFLVLFSSLDTVGWIKRHKKLWKFIHIFSYFAVLFAIFHAMTVGTDFKETKWRILLYIATILLLAAYPARLLRTKWAKRN